MKIGHGCLEGGGLFQEVGGVFLLFYKFHWTKQFCCLLKIFQRITHRSWVWQGVPSSSTGIQSDRVMQMCNFVIYTRICSTK